MKKEILALYVFIVSVFIVMFLVFSAFQSPIGGITGKVITSLMQNSETTVSCVDSDLGRNYNNKGVVDYCNEEGCFSEEDSCSGKTLVEFYCSDNEKRYENYECEGGCDDGLCIKSAKSYRYTSSGGGGGGGGGSSGGTTSTPTTAENGQTYNLGDLSEQQIEVYKYDTINFALGSAGYSLTINDNTPTQVSIISNIGLSVLTVGEWYGLDMDSDTVSDISIKVKSINLINRKITLILRPF